MVILRPFIQLWFGADFSTFYFNKSQSKYIIYIPFEYRDRKRIPISNTRGILYKHTYFDQPYPELISYPYLSVGDIAVDQ
ncbi:hypothetical protein EWM64_g8328 [Hericium alpestre]|uniref:Uncharacterized protein n=1 Tax=Hericium alpestre TaxID=135208 RepID=A0A4Y9ZN46_9AGAM|nr:hypothetical protein EWM64_g8328 [Hericium alpestre]